jgi:tetratricopeptide (TPR) repeat protein
MTMSPRRRSDDLLPRAPLDFAYPLAVRGAGSEAAVILAELPPEHAFHVLRVLRLVLSWARDRTASAGKPADSLRAWVAQLRGARCSDALCRSSMVIVRQLRSGRADAVRIAAACFELSDWAFLAGAESTALLFAETGALAHPVDPRWSWKTGRTLRDYGRMRDAERWLRRAVRVAVWNGDMETLDLALNSLGNLHRQQGNMQEAVRYLTRALRVAKRPDRGRRASVTHDLFNVALLKGEWTRAEQLAASALDLYGPGHGNIPKLAHDVAQLWLRQGRFSLALPVLMALSPKMKRAPDRLRVLASVARAAGACGDRRAYGGAWTHAWELVGDADPQLKVIVPAALVDVGLGAASLGEWGRAVEALTLAVVRAKESCAHEDAARAESALEMIRRQEGADWVRPRTPGAAARLSDVLVRTLAGEAAQ